MRKRQNLCSSSQIIKLALMQYDLWFDHVKHEFSVSIPLHLANVKTNIKIKTDTEYKMSKVMYCFGQSPYNIC